MKSFLRSLFCLSVVCLPLAAQEGALPDQNFDFSSQDSIESRETEEALEESLVLDPDKLALLNPNRQPKHIAIIPDGNRRWAKNNGVMLHVGYKKGAKALLKIVAAAKQLGIEALTFYCFSTENWRRSAEEVGEIMKLFEDFLMKYEVKFIEQAVKVEVIGDLSRLSPSLLGAIEQVRDSTRDCDQIRVILAMNYGGRDEMARAVQNLAKDCASGVLRAEELNEEIIESYLDTAEWSDPDLLIRTSGERRLSNFLLWQLSYAELAFPLMLWPDYTPNDFLDTLIEFQQRQRRFGGP